jgi:hypothetical protein
MRMKKVTESILMVLISIFLVTISLSGCKKEENPIKYPIGAFPDSVFNLMDINSPYDDFNLDIQEIVGAYSLIFSSNRGSSGGQFDMVQGTMTHNFSKTSGVFDLQVKTTQDAFYAKLLNAANTAADDFGPFTLFSPLDGHEYLILSSLNGTGNLDFYYLRNWPKFNANLPDVMGPYPLSIFNTNSNDAYLSLNTSQDTAYFSSDRNGNFDIYFHGRPSGTKLDAWFNQPFSNSLRVDSLNSSGDDKCPHVYKKFMIFASDRPGGLGGYDLYYAILRKGKWSTPINFGPGINTAYDEYRPVLGSHPDYSNHFLMFSSNRPGGKGGFDLYFTGYEFPGN